MIASLLLSAALAAPAPARAAGTGILLLAHGGDQHWNTEVADIAAHLNAELALGMADLGALQSAVTRLEKSGAKRVAVVPLFVHSRSEVLDQTRYALGLSTSPSPVFRDAVAAMTRSSMNPAHHHHSMSFTLDQVKTKAKLALAPALDDHPLVADVLARRAKALSKAPKKETVLLVGHGPVDEAANRAWLETMTLQAGRVKKAGGYREVRALTIRDDSPRAVKEPALAALRDAVAAAKRDGGRAIVVPYLIARGGIESHITDALKGLDYAWDGRALCPDPAIETILKQRARAALEETR